MDYLKSFPNMIKCWIWKQPERLLTKFELENLSPEEAEYLIKIKVIQWRQSLENNSQLFLRQSIFHFSKPLSHPTCFQLLSLGNIFFFSFLKSQNIESRKLCNFCLHLLLRTESKFLLFFPPTVTAIVPYSHSTSARIDNFGNVGHVFT